MYMPLSASSRPNPRLPQLGLIAVHSADRRAFSPAAAHNHVQRRLDALRTRTPLSLCLLPAAAWSIASPTWCSCPWECSRVRTAKQSSHAHWLQAAACSTHVGSRCAMPGICPRCAAQSLVSNPHRRCPSRRRARRDVVSLPAQQPAARHPGEHCCRRALHGNHILARVREPGEEGLEGVKGKAL